MRSSSPRASFRLTWDFSRLVDGLGLKSTLTQYKVPKDDVPKIAAKSVGGEDQPDYAKVVKLLENLY